MLYYIFTLVHIEREILLIYVIDSSINISKNKHIKKLARMQLARLDVTLHVSNNKLPIQKRVNLAFMLEYSFQHKFQVHHTNFP